MRLAAGDRLGPYTIVAPLGAGGMGEVYRAHDTKLGRDVALKVLPDEVAATPEALARFEREARTVASLNHPNIVTLHSLEEVAGVRFITMELVEGANLAERVAGGSLPIADLLALAIPLADALGAAHARGVVHRDLKPANVMMTKEGQVKVLDFGLATRAAPSASMSHVSTLSASGPAPGFAGTVPYMAPEQLRGDPVDARADLFAFGAILYELASGRRPFDGGSVAEVSSAILRDEPPPLRTRRVDAPVELERIVDRCLRKQPAERWANARDLARVLRELQRALERGGAPDVPTAFPARPSVAVMPFRDLQDRPENADLGLGLADATITELTLMRSLVVRPTSAILRYHGSTADPRTAADELAVDAVVEGTFQRSGQQLRVTVQLVSRDGRRPTWGTKIDTSLEDVFKMQDEVSRRIATALDVQLSPAEDRRLAEVARPAPAGDAYTLYMGGKRHLYRGTLADVNAAIERFERARDADPGFAPAWAGLGDAYARMAFEHAPEGNWKSRAHEICERALAIDPTLPEARYLRARLKWNPVEGFDHAYAIQEAAAALADRPSLTEARYLLGLVLFHVGLLEESGRTFAQVLDADPGDCYALIHIGTVRLHQVRLDEAFEIVDGAVRQAPGPWVMCLLAHVQIRLGRLDDAARTVERLAREAPDYSEVHALAGLVAARRGDRKAAMHGVELTSANPRAFGHFHHAQYDVACIHTLLGETDRALTWLAEAAHNGYPCYPYFKHDPLLESARTHAGFGPLMRELEAECAGYQELYQNLPFDPTS